MKIEKIINSGVQELFASVAIQISGVKEQPKFVPSFDGEYYSISYTEKSLRADCPACGRKGTITGLDGKEYECPNCHGKWQDRQVIGKIKQWYIRKFQLAEISVVNVRGADCVQFNFECINSDSRFAYDNKITVKGSDIKTMQFNRSYYGSMAELQVRLTDNYAEALAEIKRLNKIEKEKHGESEDK